MQHQSLDVCKMVTVTIHKMVPISTLTLVNSLSSIVGLKKPTISIQTTGERIELID